MIKKTITILLLLSLTGCIVHNSAPNENLEFAQASEVLDYKGVYKNLGEPELNYLSELVWMVRTPTNRSDPYVKDIRGNLVQERFIDGNSGKKIRDKEIELVEVLPNGTTLTINAIKDGCIIATKDYEIGRDFTLTDGKIILRKEVHLLTRGGGDVILGPSYEKVELGLDAKGNGKYKSQGYFAGLVFMLIPMAAGGADEVKFEKVNTSIKFEVCK